MSEPTSALSYEDLILRVAREAGISYHGSGGGERAMIPVDEHDLDLCKTIVNDAIRMFISDAPPKGWRWMRRIMSVVLTATRVTGTADSASTTGLVDLTLATAYNYLHYVGTCTASEFSIGETVTQGTSNATGLITAITATTLDITIVSGTADKTNDWTHGAHTFTTVSAIFPLEGYYIYITGSTGLGSYAIITGYNALTGAITVADWLDAYGNSGGTDPIAGSTFAITPVETVGGDISRYPLAENFGGEVNGQIHYEENTSHTSLIEWRDEAYIRARRTVTVITGYPQFAAIRPLEFYAGGTGPKRRWELILDRDPSAADTLEFPYTLHFNELRIHAGTGTAGTGIESLYDTALVGLYPDDYFNGWTIKIISGTGKNSYALVDDYTNAPVAGYAIFDIVDNDWLSIDGTSAGTHPASGSVYVVTPPGNLHPAGLRFDEAIKAACLAQAEIDIEDISAGFTQKYIQQTLQKAYAIDTRSAPRKLGSMNRGERHVQERTWTDITYD